MVIEVPMLAFVITVDQVSAYAVALFRRAMLLLHVMVLVSKQVTTRGADVACTKVSFEEQLSDFS